MSDSAEDLRRLRFGVFLHDEKHRRVLAPVTERLRPKHDVRVSMDAAEIVAFNPHVVIACEQSHPYNFHLALPFSIVVLVRPCLTSKRDLVEKAGPSDYACVTSYSVRSWLRESGFEPRRDFWVTGSPCTDPLCAPVAPMLPFIPPAGKKIVLYVPTAKTWLTSVHLLGARTFDLLRAGRDDVFVVVRPHPENVKHQPGWLRHLRAAAEGREDVFITTGGDDELSALLKIADVLVTDIAEAMFPFLARDRPIVLLTNPGFRGAKDYDEKSFVWLWRDLGEEVYETDDISAAICRALDQPDARAEARRRYRQELFGDLADGESSRRLAIRLDRLRYEAAGSVRMALQYLWLKTIGGLVSQRRARGREATAESIPSSSSV